MIQQKIEDNIIIASIDNGKTNSITEKAVDTLSEIVQNLNENDDVKGLVITGAGKTFSSGFDLPMFLGFKDLDEVITFFRKTEEIYINLFTCKKPVVAALNGAAVAGGFITAMAADYRIVKNHPKIKLGMNEIKIGLGLSIVQTEIVRFGLNSDRTFRDVMYFGDMYDVQMAKEIGIVDEIAEEADLISRAKQVVCQWIDNPGRAFMLLKSSLRKPYEDRMRQRLRDEEWEPHFKIMFNPQTRALLEIGAKMQHPS
ncbi:MAG: enoyl-CoA hydratase/isomerase family protein [Chrysiogenales bacterium]|nr:MAG: enoyl-CoA hydratase/isomerase family protein [Chrysiogenales bacterium]